MNTKQLLLPLIGVLLCGEIARGADWQAVAQPDLKEQLAQAPALELETLAAPADSAACASSAATCTLQATSQYAGWRGSPPSSP